MTCVSSGIFCSLLFLALFVTSQTLAKPGNSANSTPVSSTATKECNKVYNNFYHAGPNKKIEIFLQEMKKQLNHVEDSINILKANKTLEKEPNNTIETILHEMKKQLSHVEDDINILKANNTLMKETSKKMETLLKEMKQQLTHVEDDINILKANKTSVKEPNKKIETLLQEMKKQLTRVEDDINILKGDKTSVKGLKKKIDTLLQEMKKQFTQMQDDIDILKKIITKKGKNCAELYKSGQRISGVYTIEPDGSGAFDVFCDQTTAGGGWTVFQKRLDGSVNFYRGWADYKRGFGNLNGEFWLGLDKIHRLTKTTKNRLRVDLEDTAGKTAYAEYDMFAVTSERTKYKLSLGSYSGTAGDSLSYHRGRPFTTKDQDNDSSGANCAVKHKGAWWYGACHSSNLNGLYHHGAHKSHADGVNWHPWKGHYYSAKRAEMKIRPVHF
ncbi:uncharacterized protein LOC144641505 isoform X3 [Oculina patagonica]